MQAKPPIQFSFLPALGSAITHIHFYRNYIKDHTVVPISWLVIVPKMKSKKTFVPLLVQEPFCQWKRRKWKETFSEIKHFGFCSYVDFVFYLFNYLLIYKGNSKQIKEQNRIEQRKGRQEEWSYQSDGSFRVARLIIHPRRISRKGQVAEITGLVFWVDGKDKL